MQQTINNSICVGYQEWNQSPLKSKIGHDKKHSIMIKRIPIHILFIEFKIRNTINDSINKNVNWNTMPTLNGHNSCANKYAKRLNPPCLPSKKTTKFNRLMTKKIMLPAIANRLVFIIFTSIFINYFIILSSFINSPNIPNN